MRWLAVARAVARAGRRAGARAQTARAPVVGGGSYNDAPLLDPGSFSDTVLPGERLFYGFKLEAGQRLHVTARLRGVSDDAFKDVADVWAVGIETPLREVEIQDLVDRDVTGNGTLTGTGTARIEFVSEPALTMSAAREEDQTYRGPGTWFVNVYVATTKTDPVRRELPVDLDVAVEGDAAGGPEPRGRRPPRRATPDVGVGRPATTAPSAVAVARPRRARAGGGVGGWRCAGAPAAREAAVGRRRWRRSASRGAVTAWAG